MAIRPSTISRFRFSNRRHVRCGAAKGNSESGCVMHEIRNFSAPDFVLAGKTIDIRAGTPDPPSLDDHRLLSGLCQMPGKVFSAFTAPDDDILIILDSHVRSSHQPPSGSGCDRVASPSGTCQRKKLHSQPETTNDG